ncbi:MAG: heme o synthase [Limisphaerales bacterium]
MDLPAIESSMVRTVSGTGGRNSSICGIPNLARILTDFLVVTKARANVAVVATTFVGFALNAEVLPNLLVLLSTLGGTALVAGAAAMANQAREQLFDRRMARTRHRPIAAGRMRRRTAEWVSAGMAAAGCLWLALAVNTLAMVLAALSFVIYVFAYTGLKRRTPLCTLVGAISGALPLLVGWAASGVELGIFSSVAFIVLFLWQMPHFLAFAWWRRADYLGAGYEVLPRQDLCGYRTAACALSFTIAVFASSLIPAFANLVHGGYWVGALAVGGAFSFYSIRFLMDRTEGAARSLFLASLYYLPALFAIMLICKRD